MIISRKKYEKLNDDLIDAKAKVDSAKKALDDENKIMRASLLIKEQRDRYKEENKQLKEYIKHIEVIEYQRDKLEEENSQLKDVNKDKDNLLSEISQHIGNKPSISTYKYFRAKLDSIGIKVGE